MSVWETFSASLHMVQEKLEHVLEDSTTEEGGKPEPSALAAAEVDGGDVAVTTEQPHSPQKKEGGEVTGHSALEAAEQQIQLIHEEYKKLLREKEDEILQLKSVIQEKPEPDLLGMDVVSKELAAHKEVVTELRQQLVEKEKELQELHSKAEGKFNRLKTQAKNKIATLSKELEKLREEQGASPLNISAQVLDSSSMSMGGGVDAAELQEVKEELAENHKEMARVREQKEALQLQLDSLHDKLNVAEVCLGKEKEERVRLELRVTELEEEMEAQTMQIKSVKHAAKELEQSLSEEQAHSRSLLQQLEASKVSDRHSDREAASSSENVPSHDSPPIPEELVRNQTPIMAAGDRGSLVDMEQEICQQEASLKEKDEQLSSFKSILEQTRIQLKEAQEQNSSLAARIQQFSSDRVTLTEKAETLSSQLMESQGTLEATCERAHQLEETVERLGRELEETVNTRNRLQQELQSKEGELDTTIKSVESQKQMLHEKSQQLSEKDSELERVRAELQEVISTNVALKSSLDGDRQSAADKLAHTLEQIQELEQTVTNLRSLLREKESEVSQLNVSCQGLEHSLSQVNESLQQSQSSSQSEAERLSSELNKVRQDTQQQIISLESGLQMALQERDAEKLNVKETREERDGISRRLSEVEMERDVLTGQLEQLQSQYNKTTGALEFAENEIRNKSSVIQNLSQALEEKKAAVAELTKEVSTVRSDGAGKLADILQKNEQLLELNASLERSVCEKETTLKAQEQELETARKLSEQLQANLSSAEEQLQVAQAQLQLVEKEKETSLTEKEELCGQVNVLSQSQTELEEKCRNHDKMVAQLQAKVSESSSQIVDLQKKLQTAKQHLSRATKESREGEERVQSLQAELERYNKENRQMKEQFDSAVSLMEIKASEQTQIMNRTKENVEIKETEIARLKEQVMSDKRTIGELRERVTKSTADYKISTERCRLIEQECQQLQGRIGELELELSQLQHTVSDVTAQREALGCEHQALVSGMQEHETRALEMTSQVAELARDKEGLESRLREASRQLSLSELSREQLNSELEALRLQVQDGHHWETEKQALLEGRSRIELEKAQAEANHSSLLSQVEQLQSTLSQLRQELHGCQLELERKKADTSKSEDIERRLAEAERTHASKLTELQQKLQEETEKRQMAERSVQEFRSEVSIGMDDMQPAVPSAHQEGEKTLVDYVNTAVAWGQRLIRNPNIVLTRLLRATPQTKLFFLAYFVLLHLVVLFIIIL